VAVVTPIPKNYFDEAPFSCVHSAIVS
jgi:hypothetical protein